MLETMLETTEPLRDRMRELAEDGAERTTEHVMANDRRAMKWLVAGAAVALAAIGLGMLFRRIVLRNRRVDGEVRDVIEENTGRRQHRAAS